jgi:hypothetical protein
LALCRSIQFRAERQQAPALSQVNSSRRGFLTALGAGVTFLCPRSLDAAESDPRLAQVLRGTISIDLHSHVGIPFGKPDAPLPRFDLPGEMKRTGFSVVIQTRPGKNYVKSRSLA